MATSSGRLSARNGAGGYANRPLGHIVGYIDLDVAGLVDLIIDTINKEL